MEVGRGGGDARAGRVRLERNQIGSILLRKALYVNDFARRGSLAAPTSRTAGSFAPAFIRLPSRLFALRFRRSTRALRDTSGMP